MDPDLIVKLKNKLFISGAKIKTVVLEETAQAVVEEKVAHRLVGKILSTKRINREAFRSLIPSIWKINQGMSVEQLRDNMYVFHFKSEQEKKRVLNEGPWSFNNSLIVLVEPVGVGDISKMRFNEVSFWIQLHDLPVICMDKEIGWRLGKMIGVVEDIDTGASGDCLGKYLRVRVRIDVEQPLERAVNFVRKDGEDPITLLLAYERLPEFCYHCGVIGHSQKECLLHKGDPISLNDLEPNFGDHLRASSPSSYKKPSQSHKTNPDFKDNPNPGNSDSDQTLALIPSPANTSTSIPFSSPGGGDVSAVVSSKESATSKKPISTSLTVVSSPITGSSPQVLLSPAKQKIHKIESKLQAQRTIKKLSPKKKSPSKPRLTFGPPSPPTNLASKGSASVPNPISPMKSLDSPEVSEDYDSGVVSSPIKRWKRRTRAAHLASSMDVEEECRLKRGRENSDMVTAEKKQKLEIVGENIEKLAVAAGQHCQQP